MEPRPAPSRVLEHSGPRTAAGSTSGPAPEGVASPPPPLALFWKALGPGCRGEHLWSRS